MIATPVEPSRLAYDVYCLLRGSTSHPVNLREFHDYTEGIKALFKALDQSKLRIAMTKEIYRQIQSQVPYSAPAGAQAHVSLAVDMFSKLLPRYIAIVHEYADHNFEVQITDGVHDPLNLIVSDPVYAEWADLLGLILMEQLPAMIVREANTASVFNSDRCTIQDSNQTVTMNTTVVCDPCDQATHRALALWRLALLVGESAAPAIVPCYGTSTHHSMWGNKAITALTDVPTHEKKLLTAFMQTGLVEGFALYDFNTPRAAANPAVIELAEVDPVEGDAADIIAGLLVGIGILQNAQSMTIQVRKGTGKLIKQAFGNQIDQLGIERLQRVISSRALTGLRRAQ